MANNNRAIFRFRGPAPEQVFSKLPELSGRPILVEYRPRLTAWKGQLLSKSHKGDAVYAGCFLRKRRIVLDDGMLRTPRVLERIFVHEVFHFVWSRTSPGLRTSWEEVIDREIAFRVPGELGWSAESMKQNLGSSDRHDRNRRWKDYLCESFCDSAGWYFGSASSYAELTLDRDSRFGRRAWIRENLIEGPLTI